MFEHHGNYQGRIDHPSQANIGIHPFPDRLYVVTMLENPLRWRSRYRNYWTFHNHVETAGAKLYTAEVAFGGRDFEITESGNPNHLQLRATNEIWRKENALNLMIQRLPNDWKYVAWIDADVVFARPDWAQETLHQLQHYDVIQMFSHVVHIGPTYEPTREARSFVWNYIENRIHRKGLGLDEIDVPMVPGSYSPPKGMSWNHTGFAWAARRKALSDLGGLMDFCITGSADWHMAAALVGNVDLSLGRSYPKPYVEAIKQWESRAIKHVLDNPSGGVGYVPGMITHHWHGRAKDRGYDSRWKLLANSNFDPARDLTKDTQGLWQLNENNILLRDGMRAYGRNRNEDATEE